MVTAFTLETMDGWRNTLRAATYSGDGPAVVGVLANVPLPGDALQLAGDGRLLALAQHAPGAVELATDCFEALRQRD